MKLAKAYLYTCIAAAQLMVFFATFSSNFKPTTSAVIAEIELMKFENKYNTDEDGSWCDPGTFVTWLCETLFEIKLSSSIKKRCTRGFCHYIKRSTKDISRRDGIVDFHKEDTGLKKIIEVKWKNWDGGFQFTLLALDRETVTFVDLIDTHYITVKIDPQPNKTVAISKNFKSLGIRKQYKTTFTFNVKAYCAKDYFGKQCTIYCDSTSDPGRYTCNHDGSKKCMKGWYGVSCNIGCLATKNDNYKCDRNGRKICSKGWTGSNCKQRIPRPTSTSVQIHVKTQTSKRVSSYSTQIHSSTVNHNKFSTVSPSSKASSSKLQTTFRSSSVKSSHVADLGNTAVTTSGKELKKTLGSSEYTTKFTVSPTSSLKRQKSSTANFISSSLKDQSKVQTTHVGTKYATQFITSSSESIAGKQSRVTEYKTSSLLLQHSLQTAKQTIGNSKFTLTDSISSSLKETNAKIKTTPVIMLPSTLNTMTKDKVAISTTELGILRGIATSKVNLESSSSSRLLPQSSSSLSSSSRVKLSTSSLLQSSLKSSTESKLHGVSISSPSSSDRVTYTSAEVEVNATQQVSQETSSRSKVFSIGSNLEVSPSSALGISLPSIVSINTNQTTRLPGVKSSREFDMQNQMMQGAVSGVGLLILLCIASLVYFKCRATGNKTQRTVPEKTGHSTKFIRFDQNHGMSYPPPTNNVDIRSHSNPVYSSEGIMLTPCGVPHTYDVPLDPVPDYCFVPPKSVLRQKGYEDDCDLTSVSSLPNHAYANLS